MTRKPDVEEALTGQQLCEAVADWLKERGRLAPALYSTVQVTTHSNNTTTFRARKDQPR